MSSSPAHLSRLEPVKPDRSALTCWSGAPKQLGDATVPARCIQINCPRVTQFVVSIASGPYCWRKAFK